MTAPARTSTLDDRRLALEEAFLRRASPRLHVRLRGPRRRSRDECVRACGAIDRETLDLLLRLGLTPESVAALCLVPLVAVAWARGEVDAVERRAWLDAAAKCGLDEDAPAREMLEGWLGEPPDRELFESWTRLSKVVCDRLEDDRRDRLRAQLIGRARAAARVVAESLGQRSLDEEERELAKLGSAF